MDMTTAKSRRAEYGKLWDGDQSVREKAKRIGMSRNRYIKAMELAWARQQSKAIAPPAQQAAA